MAWLARDWHGTETISSHPQIKCADGCHWADQEVFEDAKIITLPQGAIKLLIGRETSWYEVPIEFTVVVK
jgi:hypothetical protein